MAAHQEKAAKPPLKAQTGWLFWTDHPVRAFLTLLMARPPLLSQEGTTPLLIRIHSHLPLLAAEALISRFDEHIGGPALRGTVTAVKIAG